MHAIVIDPDLLAACEHPNEQEAEDAVRTLIRWAGDDPQLQGLLDTPKRVAHAYRELFSGYDKTPEDVLARTFSEVAGYNDMVIVMDIPFHSHCEHHMVLFHGMAHLCPRQGLAWTFEDGAVGRSLCSPPADPSDDAVTDCPFAR